MTPLSSDINRMETVFDIGYEQRYIHNESRRRCAGTSDQVTGKGDDLERRRFVYK